VDGASSSACARSRGASPGVPSDAGGQPCGIVDAHEGFGPQSRTLHQRAAAVRQRDQVAGEVAAVDR
jgi:hypothetical protein